MKKVSKTISLDSSNYYRVHLELINPILPVRLSDRELLVLSCMMGVGDCFSKEGRKKVREKMGLSFGSLTNYIRQLKDKGFILGEDGDYRINGLIVPNGDSQEYYFKIVRNEE